MADNFILANVKTIGGYRKKYINSRYVREVFEKGNITYLNIEGLQQVDEVTMPANVGYNAIEVSESLEEIVNQIL